MKRTIGALVHAAALGATLMAIWAPFGGRIQWIATAIVLVIVGAIFLEQAGKTTYYHPSDDEPPLPTEKGASGTEYKPAGVVHEAESYGPRPRPTYGVSEDDER